MQDTFERKTMFKEYAEGNLIGKKKEIEHIIKDKADLVSEEEVKERFGRHLEIRQKKKEKMEEDEFKNCQKIGLDMFEMLSQVADHKQKKRMA